jgi:hypothetical protein
MKRLLSIVLLCAGCHALCFYPPPGHHHHHQSAYDYDYDHDHNHDPSKREWVVHIETFSLKRYAQAHWTFEKPCEVLMLTIISETSKKEPVKGMIYGKCPAEEVARWNAEQALK